MSGFRVTDADLDDFVVHAAARATLVALGETKLARGAAIVGTVAALTLAATPAADAAALATAVERLSAFVVTVEAERRGYVAALLDAALAAQAEARMATGLPPHGRRFDGWMAEVAAGTPGGHPKAMPSFHRTVPPGAALLYAEASRAVGVDAVLCAVAPVVAAMADAAGRSRPSPARLDFVEARALGLCVWPASTAAEAADARPIVGILERTLRRRRPLAAAILAAKLGLDSK